MDNYQGDLTDILRASGGVASLGQSHDGSAAAQPVSGWEFTPDHDPLDRESNVFGDPFMNIRDPLLHELNVAGSGYFSSCSNSNDNSLLGTTAAAMDNTSPTAGTSFCGANGGGLSAAAAHQHQRKVFDHHQEEMMQKASTSPSAMFSRIQISRNNPAANLAVVSPCESPVMAAVSSPRAGGGGFKTSAVVSTDMINANSSNNCLIENTAPALISSPRNLGIKRRKSQAKKVVCIPAPAAANSRPSGEVVPSDLWAWRKYGQKPIKGSPYPRGYYRCSSSKGCSARKQVERSRTDPNMLVITYTSEHNHPWPTQRNALAGSTRSQPPKNTAASKSWHGGQKGAANAKEEQKESSNDALSPTSVAAGSTASAPVKEEVDEMERQMEMEDNEFSEGFPQSYRPAMPPDSGCGGQQPDQDFFADLGEIEADPLDLLFTQGFSGDEQKDSQSLDPFSIFDWSVDTNNNITNTSSYGEAKRGL